MTDIKKLIRRNKKTASGIALVLAVVLIFWAVNSPAIVGASASTRQLPIYCVEKKEKVVSLSFDAAWGNEDTDALIEILNKYGIQATFFVVGDWVVKFPESVKALSEAGNEIMNHSASHAHFSKLNKDEIIADIDKCNTLISDITGITPTLFRCPYGEYDDHVISTISGMGMTAIQWDVDSLDWKGLSADEIQKRVIKKVVPGSIVLFHNAADNTPAALPGIIEALQADGYSIVPVSQILLTGKYTIDHTGKQCEK